MHTVSSRLGAAQLRSNCKWLSWNGSCFFRHSLLHNTIRNDALDIQYIIIFPECEIAQSSLERLWRTWKILRDSYDNNIHYTVIWSYIHYNAFMAAFFLILLDYLIPKRQWRHATSVLFVISSISYFMDPYFMKIQEDSQSVSYKEKCNHAKKCLRLSDF
jgi:hypothetical protein